MTIMKVEYTRVVIDFMMREITSKSVYEKIDGYRTILSLFPEIGRIYDPLYDAARPPFPCRFIPVPDTPFTMYCTINNAESCVIVFAIEYQRSDPFSRFSELDI